MDDDNMSYHPSCKNINTQTYFATKMSNRSRKIQSGLKSFNKPPPLLSIESPLNSEIKKSPNKNGIRHNIFFHQNLQVLNNSRNQIGPMKIRKFKRYHIQLNLLVTIKNTV